MYQHNLNPGAQIYNLNGQATSEPNGSRTIQQVSAPPSPYLEARLLNLEVAHGDLRGDVDKLKELYHDLYNSSSKVSQDAAPAHAGFASGPDLDKSHQSAMRFKQELEQISREVRESVTGDAGDDKANSGSTPKFNHSVPPHVQDVSVISNGSKKSMPPHLRGRKQLDTGNDNVVPKMSIDTTKHKHEPLVTDGPVDTIFRQPTIPAVAPSPPPSPTTTLQGSDPLDGVEALSFEDWKPHYLTTLDTLSADIRAKIPTRRKMTTFGLDFLRNQLAGVSWSPGLMYMNSTTSPPLVKNRTYYMIDPTYEPYLPKAPGEHGAKLTAFFNVAPEEEFGSLPEGANSYTDVPLFVQVLPGRYAYFGNYSQTRWSDKLDIDNMNARVPPEVKRKIAEDLAHVTREAWVTRELRKHFFPRPDYEGAMLLPTGDNATIRSVDEDKHNKHVASDVKDYVQELTEWERDANMKTAMIKADFILNAFDAADADDPPALRLWWEYLECVDWNPQFYNLLVGLQARDNNSK